MTPSGRASGGLLDTPFEETGSILHAKPLIGNPEADSKLKIIRMSCEEAKTEIGGMK